MKVRPISRNKARVWVNEHHRKLDMPQGWLFGVEVLDDDLGRLGVAMAGRPCRLFDDGVTIEITRVCTLGARNACSFAYGALRRAGRALGYLRIYTYTHLDEPGTSPRAAGFVFDGFRGGGEADRPGRRRRRRTKEEKEKKARWVWPASMRAKDLTKEQLAEQFATLGRAA